MSSTGYLDLWIANNKTLSSNVNVDSILSNTTNYGGLSNTNLNVSVEDYSGDTNTYSSNASSFAGIYNTNTSSVRSYINVLRLNKTFVTIDIPEGGSYTVLQDVDIVFDPPRSGTSPANYAKAIYDASNTYNNITFGKPNVGVGTVKNPYQYFQYRLRVDDIYLDRKRNEITTADRPTKKAKTYVTNIIGSIPYGPPGTAKIEGLPGTYDEYFAQIFKLDPLADQYKRSSNKYQGFITLEDVRLVIREVRFNIPFLYNSQGFSMKVTSPSFFDYCDIVDGRGLLTISDPITLYPGQNFELNFEWEFSNGLSPGSKSLNCVEFRTRSWPEIDQVYGGTVYSIDSTRPY